ncbi:MAG: motility protein A [Lachnospiraceae bacterium]|jgi:chemotaxis protein MotA|nr:motility protein A [Lachnospiraceae bacterium]NBJ80781.1 motility protein A [bacterium 1XD42-76]NBK03990.1 motility protein A [bacterium 1XD42-94]
MDVSTLIGMIMAVALIVWGITVEKLGNFFDPQSIAIVVGGTIAAIIASYPFRVLADVPKHMMVLTRGKKYNIPRLVDQLVDLAMFARQSGLLALEEKAEEIKDPFLKQSVLMIVDANDPDKVREMLEKQMDDMIARHDEVAGIYEKASSYAPAFGMIGTLVGLINMLKGMNLDGGGGASNLGQDMSVALITTFYGSAFANIFCQPIAKKLRIRESEEELYCATVIEGIMGIQAGENPKFLREHLLACMKQSQQKKLLLKAEKQGGNGGGEG